MGMGCGMSLVKYVLFIFNLLCALCGIALLALGITYYIKIADLDTVFEEQNVHLVPIFLIVIGAIVFIIAFFGCCGAIRESHCMTITYSGFLMILIIAQVVLGAIVFIYMDDVKIASKRLVEALWDQTAAADRERVFGPIQTLLQCCGRNGPMDWNSLITFPQTCCAAGTTTCTIINAHYTGCSAAVYEFVSSSGNILGIVALAFAGVELIGFIFACCLANNIRNQSRRYA